MTTFEVTDYGYSIQAQVDYIGADLFIQLTGGSHPHIGTVTTYCKKNADKQVVRFPSHSGRFHKDDVLADVLLEEIAELFPQNCVITSGVHVDGISKEQIVGAFEMTKKLASKIAIWLKHEKSPISHPKYQKVH
ncbi:amino acid decarboxylase [Streptococcus hyointestinalis]|uniref:prenylated flavin chaperone LpdD n=1 Tax=Streptococcus hyointestinalis TaxID=1337 RepID=UPI003D018D89